MTDSTGQICLWYQHDAEAAARFYAETFPDSSVGRIHKSPADNPSAREGEPLTVEFTVQLETVMKHDDGQFLWFHPRASAMPGGVMMTIQKHLKVSDYYSGLHFMTRQSVDGAWTEPLLTPELDWQNSRMA